MREISLPGIDIRIPVLGFGCSSLMSGGRRNAGGLLQAAFDAGVRHFDVARYYGYGEAEGVLGEFIKSRRSQVTITTKFGIEPPRASTALSLALQTGRLLIRLVPAARRFLRQPAKGLIRGGAFDVKDAQHSLEVSLRELKTDYIDFYLLHDYSFNDRSPDQLIEFLENAVTAGKVRYFGLGTTIDNVVRAIETTPRLSRVVQFENSAVKRNTDKLPGQTGPALTMTHGALGESYRLLSAFLESHADTAGDWSAKLGAACSDDETLSALMLNYAVRANRSGLVLFSSKKEDRIKKNVRAVADARFNVAQIDLFAKLVQDEMLVKAVAPAASK